MSKAPEKPKSAAQMWGEELDGAEAPVDGIDREMLRRAMALNPTLKKSEGGTQRVIEKLEQANAQRPMGEVAAGPAPVTGLVDGVEHHKQKFYAEHKRLSQELAKVQKALRDLVPATQERVVALFVQHDPNMANAMTNELLKMEQRFLSEVQFNPRKVIEAQQKKRR
jgi:hypothetical protein